MNQPRLTLQQILERATEVAVKESQITKLGVLVEFRAAIKAHKEEPTIQTAIGLAQAQLAILNEVQDIYVELGNDELYEDTGLKIKCVKDLIAGLR